MSLRIIHIWTDDGTEHVFLFFVEPEAVDVPVFESCGYVGREETYGERGT